MFGVFDALEDLAVGTIRTASTVVQRPVKYVTGDADPIDDAEEVTERALGMCEKAGETADDILRRMID